MSTEIHIIKLIITHLKFKLNLVKFCQATLSKLENTTGTESGGHLYSSTMSMVCYINTYLLLIKKGKNKQAFVIQLTVSKVK